MKYIQFTSKETGFRILAALAFVGFSAIAGALSSFLMPWPFGEMRYRVLILAILSIGLASFVWSIFRLVKPTRYDHDWEIAEFIFVPLCWLLLMLTVDVCLAWLFGTQDFREHF